MLGWLLMQDVLRYFPNTKAINPQNSYFNFHALSIMNFLRQLAWDSRQLKERIFSTKAIEVALGESLLREISQPLLQFSLLKPTDEDDKGISGCYFAHATFQDFCLADAIVRRLQTNTEETLEFIKQHRYVISYQAVWPLVVGLLRAVSDNEVKLNRFLQALLAEPRESGFYESLLLIRCLEECIDSPVESRNPLIKQLCADLPSLFEEYLEEKGGGIAVPLLQVLRENPRVLERTN